MLRILISSLVGGLIMFFGGAFCHMVLELESRHMRNFPNAETMKSLAAQQGLASGIYSFPDMQMNRASLSPEEQTKVMESYAKQYKEGPAGILIVAPTGEDVMSAKQLGGEFIANVGAAFIASLVLYLLRPEIPFWGRWLLLILWAPASWLSLTFSYWLWFRFPFPFILDGLFCSLIEWSIAGLFIAAVARPVLAKAAETPAT